ncbi:transposase [Microbulbifer aggregans]|uniref:transposase n=1 Tax=Microbulbifer aggregans TaxID=1769779 RepID=UPI001CFE628B|nr:transposase [Microbulbifer aggregans]
MARRKHYNRYDDDFKATAVSLSEIPGVLTKHVAEALDIHEVMLYRWRMEMRRGEIMAKKKNIQIDPEVKSELKRLRKLERAHNLLQEEHALLKKAIQFSLQQKGKSSNS